MLPFKNLFIAYNKTENFRVLIVADNEAEALVTALSYAMLSSLSDEPENWNISEAEKIDDLHFDCDYVVCYTDY
jgi:hypothetical protein